MPQRAKLSKWKADPEAAMQRLFDSLPNGPELGRAERVSPMMGVVEYPNLIPKTFTRGLALIGDEARSVDPLSGVGSAAGPSDRPNGWPRPVDGTCQTPSALDRGLAAYGRRHRRDLAGHEFLISDFSTGRPYNPLERLTFSAATRDPICAHHLAAFGSRSIGVSAFLRPSALTRAMWVNARHAAGAHGSS